MAQSFPHLKDTESIRAEASAQYGGLSDAAALQQFHKAGRDPSVEAAALKRVNIEETAKVAADLDLAQEKVDAAYGSGVFRVIDAAVRGDALSVIVEDESGRTHHQVVGWNDKWRPTGPRADTLGAGVEAAKAKLGKEAVAEIDRRVAEATAEIRAEVGKEFESAIAELHQILADRAAGSSESEDGETQQRDGAATEQSPSGGNLAEEGHPEKEPVGNGDEGSYPHSHDDLDALAESRGFTWPDGVRNIKDKQAALQAAGITPAE